MTSVSHRQSRAFLVTSLVVFVILVAACMVVLLNDNQGILAFAHIGTRFSEGDPNGTVGYDGQFVYFIARDGADAVPYIDGPTLRYQRILLPVLARSVALGNAEIVPWAILAINILAQSIGAGLVAYLLAGFNAPALLGGLVYGLWIGGLFGVRYGLTEPLCLAFALSAVVMYTQKHYRWAIVLLMFSTLTKELGLVFAAGLALHAASNRNYGWAILLLGGPALLFLTWWGVMRVWFGTLPTIYPAAREIRFIPFNGLFAEKNPIEFGMLLFWLALPTLILLLWSLHLTFQKRGQLFVMTALMLAGAAFLAFMPAVSWQDPVAAYRVGSPALVAGLLFLGQSFPRRLKWFGLLWLLPLTVFILLPALWLGST
jgi:hypothetical protein